MKRLPVVLITLFSVLLFTTCQKEDMSITPPDKDETLDLEALNAHSPVDLEAIATEILQLTEWNQSTSVQEKSAWIPSGNILSSDKTYIVNGIAHYTFILSVGPGEYDKIGLHRIVRENSDGKPMKTSKALFHVHGNANQFATVMLPGLDAPSTPADAGISIFLAKHGIDVWGIDLGWALVPAEVTDHSFMENWGMDRQVQDTWIGMAVARTLRYFTGAGANRLFLSGHSSGGNLGYALLNEEAALAPPLRNAKAFIPMDSPVITDNEAGKASGVANYNQITAQIEGGNYASNPPFLLIGTLATNDPDGVSPIIPDFTNLQTAIFLFSGRAGNPFSHFLAGTFEDGIPTGYQFVEVEQVLPIYFKTVPYMAARYQQDISKWLGEVEDVPWDDHFADITVPVLSIDPAGGYGPLNSYATSMLGSTDVTHLNIQLRPEEEAHLDYGHIDIFFANNAEELVWKPIRQWIRNH